jgi:hypothetical protein
MAISWAGLFASLLSEVGNIETFADDIAEEFKTIATGKGGQAKINSAIAGAAQIAAVGAQIAAGVAAGATSTSATPAVTPPVAPGA